MKKLIYILGCALGLGLYSCDALDLSPEDYYGSGNFWNKESQVEGYILGLHQQLRSSYNMFLSWENEEEERCAIVLPV